MLDLFFPGDLSNWIRAYIYIYVYIYVMHHMMSPLTADPEKMGGTPEGLA